MMPNLENHPQSLEICGWAAPHSVCACIRPPAALGLLAILLALSASLQAAERPEQSGPQTHQVPAPQVIAEGSAKELRPDCSGCPELTAMPKGRFTRYAPAPELRGRQGTLPPFDPQIPKPDEPYKNPPPHTNLQWVEIAPFAIGKYEVTWEEWDLCVSDGGCDAAGVTKNGGDNGWGKGRRPVINVSWHDAGAYVRWLSNKTGKTYRLPSETEWEYAARAGTATLYSWGDQDPVCKHDAPNGAAFSDCEEQSTWPVGSFRPNRFGLHDMHGNVTEWVNDCYAYAAPGQDAEARADRSAWPEGYCVTRVVRGGSWYFKPQVLRSAHRDGYLPALRFSHLGFRVARSL